MRIVTFDLSLTRPAVCCDGQTDVCDTAGLSGHQRLQWIVDWVTDWTTLEGPVLVAIESPFINPRLGRTGMKLAELGGIVRHSLWRRGIDWLDISPSTLKKVATGKGNASKDEVLSAAFRRGDLMFDGTSNDEADAWWLWVACTHLTGAPAVDLPVTHLKGLEKLTLPDSLEDAA